MNYKLLQFYLFVLKHTDNTDELIQRRLGPLLEVLLIVFSPLPFMTTVIMVAIFHGVISVIWNFFRIYCQESYTIKYNAMCSINKMMGINLQRTDHEFYSWNKYHYLLIEGALWK